MLQKISKLFAGLSGNGHAAPAVAAKDNPATIEDGSENGFRRQLVQTLMRDLMRRHGIPPQWIDCQVMMVSSRTRGSGMYLRLVLQHWDERLMRYASAFQTELMSDIRQFEPQSAHWLYGVSWQLVVDADCPYTTLPGEDFWRAFKSASASAPEPAQQRQQAQDQAASVNSAELDRLFALRDQALEAQADQDLASTDYEKTQPMPLPDQQANTKKADKALHFQ